MSPRRIALLTVAVGACLSLGVGLGVVVKPTETPASGSRGTVESWVTDLTTDQRLDPATWDPVARRGRPTGCNDRGRPHPPVPDDDRIRGVDDRLVGVRAVSGLVAAGPAADHAGAVLPDRGHRAVDAAAADGGLRLRCGPGVLLRRPTGGADRSGPVGFQHPPRPGLHPAPAAGGVPAQPAADVHGHPVERTRAG